MTEFEYLRMFVQQESTCDKQQVAAGCYVGEKFITASNYCKFTGQICPRLGLPSGVQPELCEGEHAEIRLLESLKQMELSIRPEIVWVLGHKYVCLNCAEKLRDFGFKEIRIREF